MSEKITYRLDLKPESRPNILNFSEPLGVEDHFNLREEFIFEHLGLPDRDKTYSDLMFDLRGQMETATRFDVGEDGDSDKILLPPTEEMVAEAFVGETNVLEDLYLRYSFRSLVFILWDLLQVIEHRGSAGIFMSQWIKMIDRMNALPENEDIQKRIAFVRRIIDQRLKAGLVDYYEGNILESNARLIFRLNVEFLEVTYSYSSFISSFEVEEGELVDKVVDLATWNKDDNPHEVANLRMEAGLEEFKQRMIAYLDNVIAFLDTLNTRNSGVFASAVFEYCESIFELVSDIRPYLEKGLNRGNAFDIFNRIKDVNTRLMGLPIIDRRDFLKYMFGE